MSKKYLKKGFSVVEIIIVVAVVAIVGALGVVGYNQWKSANTATDTSGVVESQDSLAEIAVPTVTSTEDLDTATKALDDINLAEDSSDLDEIDAEATGF
ncbi:MAG: prepilin-type N-terminal cleavage/methylation domain-containing protein [Candidatus Saccharibacteria bacterium]|jgi:prepilin-type N-terminal cleavage/methylation domain-containing protein|nr:MAG: prepilin-type N-terminal cleavage/methylation domain-containing protein [Candidatus Saccharibacteria bacterium]